MKLRLPLIVLFSFVATFAWFVFDINLKILLVDTNIFQHSGPIPYVMIFGGGILPDGTQSSYQRDRVIRGVEIYKSENVKKVLITGDDGASHDNEMAAMELLARQMGVPKEDIVVDGHGYRTYESCYRARYVFGVTKAVVVSQAFHIPRIVYLCRGLGIDVAGASSNLSDYGRGYYLSEFREIFARVKAWWQLEVTRPLPLSMEK